jgi:hypothetical protein
MNEHSNHPQPGLGHHSFPQREDDPWLVQVDVFLDDVKNPKNPKFRLRSCLPQEKRNVNGKEERYLIFTNYDRNGFKIFFQLHDKTGGNYCFPNKADDAVWSKTGKKCPDEAWATNTVFQPVEVIDGKTLVVEFPNKTVIGDFRYTLRVTNDGGSTYVDLDPGGTGNNNNYR